MSSSGTHVRVQKDRADLLSATPDGTSDICGIPHHITPEGQQDNRESMPKEPDTPCKEITNKKNPLVTKPGSKRKLFLQCDKKQGANSSAVSRQKKSQLSSGSFPMVSGGVSYFPLTERQQLQYLLEVTAQQAKNEENCSDTETVNYTKIKKKEIGKENNMNLRLHKRNERGETALHVAAIKGDLEDAKALIIAGANVNGKDNAGWTPLHEACNHGHLQVAKELVVAGANINATGLDEFTPLHDAVINDHVQIIEFLVKHGADIQLRTESGHCAADLSRSLVVTRLLVDLTSEPAPSDLTPVQKMVGLTNKSKAGMMSADWTLESAPLFQSSTLKTNGQGVSIYQSEEARVSGESTQESTSCCPLPASKTMGQASASSQSVEAKLSANYLPKSPKPHGQHVLPVLLASDQAPENNGSAVFRKDDKDNKEETTRLAHDCQINKGAEEFAEDYVSISKLNECLTNAAAEMSSYLECKEVLFLDSDQENDSKNVSTTESLVCLTQESKEVLPLVSEKTVPLPNKNAMAHTNFVCNDKCVDDFTETGKAGTGFGKNTEASTHQLTKQDERLTHGGVNEDVQANSYESILDLHVNKPTASDGTTVNKPFKRNEIDSPKPRTVSPRKKRRSTMGRTNASSLQNGSSYTHSSSLQNSNIYTVVSVSNDCASTLSSAPTRMEQVPSKLGKRPATSSSYSKTSTLYTNHSKTPNTQASQDKTPTLCANHIKTPTWRRVIAKHRYQISALPVHVPSFEGFTMHTKSYLLHEQSREDDILTSGVGQKSRLEELSLSHQVEKDKLKLCVEQELVRAFTNFARDVVDKPVPYSACFVLKAQAAGSKFEDSDCTLSEFEIGSSLRTEVTKILNKFEQIKQGMLSRQKLEYEAVLALQQLDPDLQAEAPPHGRYIEDFDMVPLGFREQFERLMYQNCLV